MFNQYKMPKQKPYSVTHKLAVIGSIRQSKSQGNMSHDNGMLESTIYGWLRAEEKLYDYS